MPVPLRELWRGADNVEVLNHGTPSTHNPAAHQPWYTTKQSYLNKLAPKIINDSALAGISRNVIRRPERLICSSLLGIDLIQQGLLYNAMIQKGEKRDSEICQVTTKSPVMARTLVEGAPWPRGTCWAFTPTPCQAPRPLPQ
jgi:hypothetical protein